MKKQYNAAQFTERYIEVTRELGGGTVVVSGGGALLMLGLRASTADLDLDVTEAVVQKHRTLNNTERFGDTEIVNYSDDTSLHVLDPLRVTHVVHGVRIYSIADLIAQKKVLIANPNRSPEKIAQDRVDLKALQILEREDLRERMSERNPQP